MYTDTRTYIDYNGEERTNTAMFNLSKAEVARINIMSPGGLDGMLKEIIESRDGEKIMNMFDAFMKKSYGKKSPDGSRFIKSDELWEEYIQTEAYSDFFIELLTDGKKAADFINNVIPNVPDNMKISDVSELSINDFEKKLADVKAAN